MCAQGIQFVGKVCIFKQSGSLGRVLQHVIYHLVVHAHSAKERVVELLAVVVGIGADAWMVLRRIGGAHHHIARIGVFHQEVLEELRASLQHRIDFCEILFVAREEVFLPQVRGKPCVAGGPHSHRTVVHGTGGAPQVGVVVQYPSAGAIHLLCCLGSGYAHILHHINERQVALGQVAHLCRPVVHFHVDVGGVFGVPCRILACVGIPDALQVGWLCAWLG